MLLGAQLYQYFSSLSLISKFNVLNIWLKFTLFIDIPEILKQSDPSHPIHDKVPKAFLSDENLSNISDSEVENSLLTIQEVQQKIALYCTQTQMTIADLTY